MNDLKKDSKVKKILRDSILGSFFLVSLVLINNFYGDRIFWGVWAKAWHLFNTNTVTFENKLIIKVPSSWLVGKRNSQYVSFLMVPVKEKDKIVMIFVSKAVQTKNKLNLREIDEFQFNKTAQVGVGEVFVSRYINTNNNMIWEYWVIPTLGYGFKTTEITEELYPHVWDFINGVTVPGTKGTQEFRGRVELP